MSLSVCLSHGFSFAFSIGKRPIIIITSKQVSESVRVYKCERKESRKTKNKKQKKKNIEREIKLNCFL